MALILILAGVIRQDTDGQQRHRAVITNVFLKSGSSCGSLRTERAQLLVQLTAVENRSLTWQHISFHSGLVLCLVLAGYVWWWERNAEET